MKNLSAIFFLLSLPLVSCDKSRDKQKESINKDADISNFQQSLEEDAVPFKIKTTRHVTTVLLSVCDENDYSLGDLFKRQGIFFTDGASLKIVDEGVVEGRLGKSQHEILEQCLRMMEKEGNEFSKDSFHEEDCSCF